MIGLSIVIGLNSALETYVSQAAGAKNLELCGVYLNRARVITLLLAIPVTAILLNAKTILVAIKQDPDVAEYS